MLAARMISKTYLAGIPFWFRKPPAGSVESLVLRAHDFRQIRALLWSGPGPIEKKVGVVVIHPRVDFTQHYAIPRLVDAGFAVLAAQTRHVHSDLFAVHEEMVLDVDACVRHLRDRRGIEKVVLFGNCGGASLVAFYQAQARLAASDRLAETPAGDATHFATATMTPADAMIYVAPHRGQGKVLLACIDPSVADESDPLSVTSALDMYDPANGFREPPAWSEYEDGFLARFREAQVARVARLDARAREAVARRNAAARETDRTLEARRRAVHDPVMTVFRTMANPAFVDRRIDPSTRDYGSLLSERPDLMNFAAFGLARTVTPRAWLSTWSGLSSNADLVANVAKIREPTLLVAAASDREVFPRDIAAIERAVASEDKQVASVDGARHYFEPAPGEKESPHVDALMDLVVPWIRERSS